MDIQFGLTLLWGKLSVIRLQLYWRSDPMKTTEPVSVFSKARYFYIKMLREISWERKCFC